MIGPSTIAAAVRALLQARADYAARSGPPHLSEPIAEYFRSHSDKNRLDGRNQIVWFCMV
jgi:hypothetical protein